MAGILISEDDEEIRKLLSLVFQLELFTVFEAENGAEALSLFQNHPGEIQLIVTDLGLPELGGVELIQRIRKISQDVRIIGASGFGRSNVREEVLKAGADEFLPKPFRTEELIRLVHELLAGNHKPTGEEGTK